MKHLFWQIENEYLSTILKELVVKYSVKQVFHTEATTTENAYIIVHLEHKEEADRLQKTDWVLKAKSVHKTTICFFYGTQFYYNFQKGHPLITCICSNETLVYEKEKAKDDLKIQWNKKAFKKRYKAFKESFYHDRTLISEQINQFIQVQSAISVLLSYEKLITYDIDLLETLYIGKAQYAENLYQRITNLTVYLPKLQKLFVKQNGNSFFLTNLFAKAKEASADDDLMSAEEMYEALEKVQNSLLQLIEQRFKELKTIKKTSRSKKADNAIICSDVILEQAIETIVSLVKPEEIYLFHKATYGTKLSYYLLLIGTHISNETLKNMSIKIGHPTFNTHNFVLIAHPREWIQDRIFEHQDFFINSMRKENLVYASHPYHPEIHWETPYQPPYPDLNFYLVRTLKCAEQIVSITKSKKRNHTGIHYLFSLFFLSFCRTYLFAKVSYCPNYLASWSLWKLCLFANSDLHKYHYLFDCFSSKFFNIMDYRRNVHQGFEHLNKKDVKTMSKIIKELSKELKEAVEQTNKSIQ